MKGEHRMSSDEQDAFTGWRRVLRWRPGQRKAVKARSHRRDRRVARQQVKDSEKW